MNASIGLDIGSTSTKAVLLHDGVMDYAITPTGWSPRNAGEHLMKQMMDTHGLTRTQVGAVITTGYGRTALTGADQAITEITCHARGAAHLIPGIDTIVDIGGQDSKVIKVTSVGKVKDFLMNDKCAAGTGRFLGVMATAMGLDVSELGNQSVSKPATITNMCTVFAESEVIGLLAQGAEKASVIGGLHDAVARRTVAMVNRLGPYHRVIFTGGVALNPGVRRSLEKELGIPIEVPPHCQLAGAIGAALIGLDG